MTERLSCFTTASTMLDALQRLPAPARLAIAAGTLLAYVLAFPFLHAEVGVAAAVIGVGPAVAFGWLLGIRGGLAYALLAPPIHVLAFILVGDSEIGVRHHLLGGAANAMVSVGLGWARDLQLRLRRQAERLRAEYRLLHEEIDRRIQAEARLTHQVLHDPLTNLPNRRLFLDRLQHAFDRCQRHPGALCAVLYLDLDGFKEVNDSLGHDAGDRMLLDVAERLQASVRAVDTVARIGGDEFAIVLESVTGRDGVRVVVERIREQLATPSEAGARALPLPRASIGAVIGLTRYQEIDEILRDADSAMYLAKAGGGDGFVIFSPDEPGQRAAAGLEAGAA